MFSFRGIQDFFSGAKSSPPSAALERHAKRPHRSSYKGTDKQTSKAETVQLQELLEGFNQVMKEKEAEWQAKELELKDQLGNMQSQNQRLENEFQQSQRELEHRTRISEAKVQEARSEKEEVQAEYNLFIRQKQEEKFKEMGSWPSVEGSKVMGDLDRLKRDMRTFGKAMSINDWSIFQRLQEASYVALMNDLAEVCVLTTDGLPEGLTSLKSPGILLNALVAHHVYKTLFKNPFFFLDNGLGDVLPKLGLGSLLNEVYSRTQQGKCIQGYKRWRKTTKLSNTANQDEAHIWRSQTLRLLLPPLRNNTSSQERDVHLWTSELISEVANLQAACFLEGPARHLICDEAKANCGNKLQSIYHTAANISYMLWTRRTTMRCYTLEHFGQPTFNPESKDLIPHSSVKFDQFEDQLKGSPISLIVHPLLRLYGTNDAKDYDRGSVWAPAEVWLDSRKLTR